MPHEKENRALPNDFTLSGTGLDGELQAFVEHLASINPSMAEVFSNHMAILTQGSTDEARRSARGNFNSAVKSDLMASLTPTEEDKN